MSSQSVKIYSSYELGQLEKCREERGWLKGELVKYGKSDKHNLFCVFK